MRLARPERFRFFAPSFLGAAILFALPSPARAGAGVWTPVGPPGGSISVLAVSASNPNLVFAGTAGSGMFKSLNGGFDWSAASVGLVDGGDFPLVSSLEIDPRRPAIVYAGTVGSGAYRSGDGGTTWTRCGGLPPAGLAARVSALRADPVAANVLYAATQDGVFRSRDGCKTWSPRRAGLPAFPVAALGFDPAGRTFYAGTTGAGLYRSTDQGGRWVKANAGLPTMVRTLGFDPRSPSVVFAGTSAGLYRSVDRGQRWARVAGEPGLRPVLGFGIEEQTGTAYTATPEGVFLSPDRGATWARTFGAPPVLPLTCFAAAPESLLVGTLADRRGGGVAVSTDGGGSWFAGNNGLSTLRPTALAFHATDPFTLYVGSGPVGISIQTNRRKIWSHWKLDPADPLISIDALVRHPVSQVLFAGSDSPGLLLRSDGADGNWRSANPPSTSTMSVLAADPRSPGALWTGGFGTTYRTPDGGETWEPVTLASVGVFPDIADIEVDPSDPLTVTYAGSRIEGIHPPRFYPILYRSTDGGTTWRSIPTGGLAGTIASFTADRDDPTVYYVATNLGLYRTEDQGATWRALLDFPDLRGDILATPGAIYASRGPSVLRSTDRGETWTPIRSGLGARPVERLWLDPHDPRHLYAGTFNAGLWEYTLPAVP